jgi:hypothetical protein
LTIAEKRGMLKLGQAKEITKKLIVIVDEVNQEISYG